MIILLGSICGIDDAQVLHSLPHRVRIVVGLVTVSGVTVGPLAFLGSLFAGKGRTLAASCLLYMTSIVFLMMLLGSDPRMKFSVREDHLGEKKVDVELFYKSQCKWLQPNKAAETDAALVRPGSP